MSKRYGLLALLVTVAACGKGPVPDSLDTTSTGGADGSGGLAEDGTHESVQLPGDTDEPGGGGGSSGVHGHEGETCGSTGDEESTGSSGGADETGDTDEGACVWNALLGCICDGELSPVEADVFGCWCGGSGAVEVPWEFCA